MGTVRRLHTVIVVDIERVQRGVDDTERFAERVVRADDGSSLGAHILRLQGIIVGEKVVGRQREAGEALQRTEFIRQEAVWIYSPIFRRQHGAHGNQVDIAANSAAVEDVPGLVSDICYFNQTRPWYTLGNGDAVTVCH